MKGVGPQEEEEEVEEEEEGGWRGMRGRCLPV